MRFMSIYVTRLKNNYKKTPCQANISAFESWIFKRKALIAAVIVGNRHGTRDATVKNNLSVTIK